MSAEGKKLSKWAIFWLMALGVFIANLIIAFMKGK